jgi:hypothetical protein
LMRILPVITVFHVRVSDPMLKKTARLMIDDGEIGR